MRKILLSTKTILSAAFLSIVVFSSTAQTGNVYDNFIAFSPFHSTLRQALQQANLVSTLQDPSATLTVFAPDNNAFNDLANELGTDINGILALPDLADILLYHVLGTTNTTATFTNGQIVTPLNSANTIKLTVAANGDFFANQALLGFAKDRSFSNGVVHSIDAVILANETVADIAIDNGFTTLVTAIATAELLPAVTDPFASLTVFAPDNTAFDNAVAELGITINDLLASTDLADILLYHVLGTINNAASFTNGQIVTPLNPANTIKLTVASNGDVFANQAQVQIADLTAENGVVHTIDEVILADETVVDAAIDNGFTSLTSAVIEAQLLPALSDPYTEFTVFAPTDAAFTDFATAQGLTLAQVLALPDLRDILLYHVLGTEILSANLSNGSVPTLNGKDVIVDISTSVMVNDATVITPDVDVDNGVVHAIDKVLTPPSVASIEENEIILNIYPNPASDFITIAVDQEIEKIEITSFSGAILNTVNGSSNGETRIDVSNLASGQYFVLITTANGLSAKKLNISSQK